MDIEIGMNAKFQHNISKIVHARPKTLGHGVCIQV